MFAAATQQRIEHGRAALSVMEERHSDTLQRMGEGDALEARCVHSRTAMPGEL